MHFEIYKDKAGEFRFRIKATNGNVLASSEGYKAEGFRGERDRPHQVRRRWRGDHRQLLTRDDGADAPSVGAAVVRASVAARLASHRGRIPIATSLQ